MTNSISLAARRQFLKFLSASPYIASIGEAGVNRVLEILQAELKLVMGNCGTQKVADINREYVTSRTG